MPHAIFVSDMSSAIGSRDLTKHDLWQDYGVIFGGAQKNFGTSGLTFTLIRDDVLQRVGEINRRSKIPVPLMMDWNKQAQVSDFFVNTPANMAIYVTQLMCEHMLKQGGVDYYEKLADKKSSFMYNFIDTSREYIENTKMFDSKKQIFFVNNVDKRLRSRMNVPFNIDCVDLRVGESIEDDLLILLR